MVNSFFLIDFEVSQKRFSHFQFRASSLLFNEEDLPDVRVALKGSQQKPSNAEGQKIKTLASESSLRKLITWNYGRIFEISVRSDLDLRVEL